MCSKESSAQPKNKKKTLPVGWEEPGSDVSSAEPRPMAIKRQKWTSSQAPVTSGRICLNTALSIITLSSVISYLGKTHPTNHQSGNPEKRNILLPSFYSQTPQSAGEVHVNENWWCHTCLCLHLYPNLRLSAVLTAKIVRPKNGLPHMSVRAVTAPGLDGASGEESACQFRRC